MPDPLSRARLAQFPARGHSRLGGAAFRNLPLVEPRLGRDLNPNRPRDRHRRGAQVGWRAGRLGASDGIS